MTNKNIVLNPPKVDSGKSWHPESYLDVKHLDVRDLPVVSEGALLFDPFPYTLIGLEEARHAVEIYHTTIPSASFGQVYRKDTFVLSVFDVLPNELEYSF